MELTADMFKEIVGSLAADGSGSGVSDEQRRGPRKPAPVQATLLPFSDAFAFRAIGAPVRDVSRGGFGFLHDRPVPLGESFALVLPETSMPPLVILCTVAYWQPLAPDLYAIGARFTQVLRQSGAQLDLDLDLIPPRARKAS